MLVHPISPTQSSDFSSDSELGKALPPQTALPLINSLLSTSALGQLSIASSPILQRQGSSGVSGSANFLACNIAYKALS